MSQIKIVRKSDGTAYQNSNKQFVFVKDGVNFALSFDQMDQMVTLISGLKDGTLIKVDPSEIDCNQI